MSPPSCQGSDAKPSPLLALVCASIVADHDRSWLARPLNALIPDGGPRPERISRLKTRLRPAFETELAQATRRGRPKASKQPEEVRRTSVLAALLAVATWLLTQSRVPTRRRAIQDHLVCAYDRLHAQHGVTQTEFCSVLDIPERTFRAWRARPPTPVPTPPPASPPPPPKNDRSTGRFDLEVTAPGVQLGGDTTDLKVFGIDLKLVGVQDLGAREQQLFEAFDVDDHEDADMVIRVLTEALAGRDSLQWISDQGTPYMAEAAKNAYEALGVEHAPQKEGTPTDKATVERGWNTVKGALEPLLDLTCRLAEVIPALRQADLARAVARLFLATFLRVYAAGRRHLSHPLEGQDPDALRAIIEEHVKTHELRIARFVSSSNAFMPNTRYLDHAKPSSVPSSTTLSTTFTMLSVVSDPLPAAAKLAYVTATSLPSFVMSTMPAKNAAPPPAVGPVPKPMPVGRMPPPPSVRQTL